MKRLDQVGATNIWLPAFVITLLAAIGLGVFGMWAFSSQQDFKNNTDKKIADAVIIAKQEEDTAKDKEFTEREKKPLKEYKGPATYGSIVIQYPKTWSGFVTESDNASNPIDAYFHPNVVPGLQSNTAFALRVKVVNQSYDAVIKSFSEKARTGTVTVSAFRAAKVQSVLGSRVTGAINTGQRDDMVIFPLRDKTLEISTESSDFSNDFNTSILPNLSFSP